MNAKCALLVVSMVSPPLLASGCGANTTPSAVEPAPPTATVAPIAGESARAASTPQPQVPETSPAPDKPDAAAPAERSVTDILDDMLGETLKKPFAFGDERFGIDFVVPAGFRMPSGWEDDIELEKGQIAKVRAFDVGPMDDISCHIAMFKIPLTLSTMKKQDELLLLAVQTAMAWDKSNRIDVIKQLSRGPLDFGGFPGYEWRAQINARQKQLYARIHACYVAGPTLDTDRICSVIYVDTSEEGLNGEIAKYFFSSLKISTVEDSAVAPSERN